MKPLFTLLAVAACSVAFAQTYQPFPKGEASWKIGRCFYFYPGGWYDEIIYNMEGDDTLINSVSYKKVIMKFYHAPGTPFDSAYTRVLGGMRESNKKIFFVSEELCLDTLERLIYDFNYERTGDTIYTNVLSNSPPSKIPHVITGIDSVLVGSAYHRRLHLADTSGNPWESWIEGVGSNWGLTYASYWTMTDNSYDLVCFNSYGGLKYVNPAPSFAFCIPPLPQIVCDSGMLPDNGCTAGFDFTRNNDTVQFSGMSNHVHLTSWHWSFGDGENTFVQSPHHIYAQPGWYEACLTVTGIDSMGSTCVATACDSIYISDGCIDSSLICLPPGGSLCCDAPLEAPVCGCDSVTYTNGCQATLWYGVMHYTDGACPVDSNTSIREKSAFGKIKLLPNPAGTRTALLLETVEQGELFVSLRNILGETLHQHREILSGRTNSRIELNLETIPSGVYMVELRMNGKMEMRKLVKE